MSLPVQCGNVLYSDSTTVTVTYDSGAMGDHVRAYDAAIRAAGWSGPSVTATPDLHTGMYTRGTSTLRLAVMDSPDGITVALTEQ